MKKRREINPQAKRTAIMAAGEALFAANGYTNTSMAEIAAKADVHARSGDGKSVARLARLAGYTGVLRLLEDAGLPPDA